MGTKDIEAQLYEIYKVPSNDSVPHHTDYDSSDDDMIMNVPSNSSRKPTNQERRDPHPDLTSDSTSSSEEDDPASDSSSGSDTSSGNGNSSSEHTDPPYVPPAHVTPAIMNRPRRVIKKLVMLDL